MEYKLKNLVPALEAGFFGLATLVAAIGLSWFVLIQANYGYGVWHDHGGIGDAIDEFGPQNRYKENFSLTSKEQRVFLFAQIVEAVHNQGKGLEVITYKVKGKEISLLREPEIVHLKDVANLIHTLILAIYIVVALLIALGALRYVRGTKLPSLKTQSIGVGAIVGLIAVVILIVGWDKLYALLHIWVFPDEHQWFFYYQDSLMSTMMWAPHLFNYIGIVWVVLAALFYAGLLYLQNRVNRALR